MPMRYVTEREKFNRILDLTSLTETEFEALVPAFETAFLEHMTYWTLEGKRRTGRRYSQYANCPLPPPHDRLFFILMYLKQAPTQLFHGVAFGMSQPKANQWIQALLPCLRAALVMTDDVPARTRAELEQRLHDITITNQDAPFFTMAPNDVSRVRQMWMNKSSVIAARKNSSP